MILYRKIKPLDAMNYSIIYRDIKSLDAMNCSRLWMTLTTLGDGLRALDVICRLGL